MLAREQFLSVGAPFINMFVHRICRQLSQCRVHQCTSSVLEISIGHGAAPCSVWGHHVRDLSHQAVWK
jgi:hypothetical protein